MLTQLYGFMQESIEQADNQASLFAVQRRIDHTGEVFNQSYIQLSIILIR